MSDFVLFISQRTVWLTSMVKKMETSDFRKHTTNVFLNVNFWYTLQQITKIRISLEHIVKKCSIREKAY